MNYRPLRNKLSMPGLLTELKSYFKTIAEPVNHKGTITIVDCLWSGLAIFSLKYPSLLQFDLDKRKSTIAPNLTTLYGIKTIPSDTYLRERLDELSASKRRGAFTSLMRTAQRGKVLERFSYYNGYYLLSIDGTGYFSSHEIHCEQCCEKHHRNGEITYYHQILGVALVHPEHSHVLPLAPEPIIKQDGTHQNDCERNAAKRLLEHIRQAHPHMKFIVVEDGLASNGPHIRQLQELSMHYILGAKPSDHQFLFNWMDTSPQTQIYQTQDENGTIHKYCYHNNIPLNDAHFDLEVNGLIYEEISPKGNKKTCSWVTDIKLSENTVAIIMKGGRSRWHIENETFNTLKNQGYHFEHNFGHGQQYLSSVFAYLMLLAFWVDQLQGLCCKLFQQAKAEMKSYVRLWERFRAYFFTFKLADWITLSQAIRSLPVVELPVFDTS